MKKITAHLRIFDKDSDSKEPMAVQRRSFKVPGDATTWECCMVANQVAEEYEDKISGVSVQVAFWNCEGDTSEQLAF